MRMVPVFACVGSLNPTKIDATRNALETYFDDVRMHSIKARSGVPDQPIGLNLIIKGAINRAKEALNDLQQMAHDGMLLGVGIEAGLVQIEQAETNYMDFQFCAIIDETDKLTLGSGIGFEYPKAVIKTLIEDKGTEIGEIMGNIDGNPNLKNESGAISILSKNRINRTDILTQAVTCALLPRINKTLYERESL